MSRVLLGLSIASLIACGSQSSEEGPTPAVGPDEAPAATSEQDGVSEDGPESEPVDEEPQLVAEALGDAECPQGYWEASDFLEAIRTQLKQQQGDFSDATITRESGALVFRIGSRELSVRAKALTHKVEARVRSITAEATHVINGEANATVRFSEDGRMDMDDDASLEGLESRVRLQSNIGLSMNRALGTPENLRGSFRTTCNGDSLVIDRVDDDPDTRPIRLTRSTEEAWDEAVPEELPPMEQADPSNIQEALQGLQGLQGIREATEALRRGAAMQE